MFEAISSYRATVGDVGSVRHRPTIDKFRQAGRADNAVANFQCSWLDCCVTLEVVA